MSDKLKNRLIGALLFFVTALGVERSAHTFLWAGQVNLEAKAGAATYKYLTEPIAKRADGTPITRAMVLDAFIQQAQRASQAQAGVSAPNNSR